MLYHVVFSFCILVMVLLSRHGDRESRHDTSVVTSHGIMSLASASLLCLKYLLLVSMQSISASLLCLKYLLLVSMQSISASLLCLKYLLLVSMQSLCFSLPLGGTKVVCF